MKLVKKEKIKMKKKIKVYVDLKLILKNWDYLK